MRKFIYTIVLAVSTLAIASSCANTSTSKDSSTRTESCKGVGSEKKVRHLDDACGSCSKKCMNLEEKVSLSSKRKTIENIAKDSKKVRK